MVGYKGVWKGVDVDECATGRTGVALFEASVEETVAMLPDVKERRSCTIQRRCEEGRLVVDRGKVTVTGPRSEVLELLTT